MWSYVGAKKRARWVWQALDHPTGRVLAYVVGTRKDAVFLKLKALLTPFGITHYYTDKAGVYRRHLPPKQHTVGKLTMQKIERKHLTLRTRLKCLARKTLCFSRSRLMHDLLIGLYMNRVEFGGAIGKGPATDFEHYPRSERWELSMSCANQLSAFVRSISSQKKSKNAGGRHSTALTRTPSPFVQKGSPSPIATSHASTIG